jgi:cell division protein FtsZ
MSKSGMAIMGIGIADGDNRAVEAAERAISHPLLEDLSIAGATGVLMNITSSSDLTMEEMTEASERIYSEVGNDAEIIWGAVIDDNLGDEMRVTVIATGIGGGPESALPERRKAAAKFQRKPRETRPEIQPEDYDAPTFLRKKKKEAPPEDDAIDKPYRGPKGMEIDNEDLDIPTFLRRKAD